MRYKLKAGTKFCPNCGHNVERFTKNSNDSNQNTDYTQSARRESSRTVKSFTQKWGSNKKRNNIILAIIILLIVFLTWGHFYYQEDNQMNRATTAIGDPDKAAAKYVTSTTSQVKINNSTVKPIQKYFQKYPGDLSSLKQKFSEGEKWNDYQFVQKGHAWLIWPRYKIQAEPNYITVNTDQKGMLIKMDGKSLGTVTSNTNTSDNGTSDVNSSDSSNSSYSRSFGPYLPGLHTFVGTKNVDGHQLKTTLISSDDTITINNGISNDNAQSLLSGVFGQVQNVGVN